MATTTDPTPAITAGAPLPDEAIVPAQRDEAPEAPKRSRSGTSRAQRRARGLSTGDAKATRDRAPRKPKAAPLAPRVEGLHLMLGMGMSFAPHPVAKATGGAMADNAEAIGKAWEDYAKANPKVAEWLDRLLTVTDLGTLVMAYMPVILAGMASSGAMPAGLAGAMEATPAPEAKAA